MVIDSDILIYFLKGEKQVVGELLKVPPQELFTTRINYTELLYGAYNSVKKKENLEKIEPFLKKFQILEFDEKSALIFAQTKAILKKEGKIIADMDLMIASIALGNNKKLVTNNHKHFERIKDLEIVKWL